MWPAEGESFDPRAIRKAVSDAGFSAPEVTVTATGGLVPRDGKLYLEMAGPVSAFLLSGGEVVDPLRRRDDLAGQRFRLRGQLHATSHADQPPGLTVEHWEIVAESDPDEGDR